MVLITKEPFSYEVFNDTHDQIVELRKWYKLLMYQSCLKVTTFLEVIPFLKWICDSQKLVLMNLIANFVASNLDKWNKTRYRFISSILCDCKRLGYIVMNKIKSKSKHLLKLLKALITFVSVVSEGDHLFGGDPISQMNMR